MNFSVKFAVIADLHVDIMPDSVPRIQAFCEAALQHRVDFLLHLGDIQYPEVDFLQQHAKESIEKRQGNAWFICDRDDEKLAVKKLLADTGLPLYGVLGNHDMDSCNKATACLYWNMQGPYYSFVEGGVRFLALDTNFTQIDGKLVDFDHCNYRFHKGYKTTFVSDDQLQWLENEILASTEPCVILSHAPLGDDLLSAQNRAEIWAMIERVNGERRRVILALNGHNHVDGLSVRHGVPFISINSASNLWIGHQYDSIRYSETISRMYPHIKGCAPYRDALFAIFEITEQGIIMQGRTSGYVGAAPEALGFPHTASYFAPTPSIRSRNLPITALNGDGKVNENILVEAY